jgi:hypothetical protein
VNAIYAGNYNDARIKALAALNSGRPAQLSVMFSIDIYELIEQDAIVAFDDIVANRRGQGVAGFFLPDADGKRPDRRQDLGHSVPALHHRHVLQQGCVPRRRSRSGDAARHLGRTGGHGQEAHPGGRLPSGAR